ncbi:MAG: hypothetical protein U5K75_05740 [Ahrensia sp.]|nr:hypothetical protein [Ahrensia sp.]
MRLNQLLLAVAILFTTAAPVLAHSGGAAAGANGGIDIGYITHDQMQVIYQYHDEVLAIAARQFAPAESFSRILNYAHIQRTYCALGMMPSAVTDEESPFNECSHAYLAATQDLLLHMMEMPKQSTMVQDLVQRVDLAMIKNGAALQSCQFSEIGFNTANIITPDWRAALEHLPSLATLMGLVFGFVLLAFKAFRVKPESPNAA